MNSEANLLANTPTLNTANVISGVIRYLHAVRVRKGTLLATVLISAILGAIYYTTATCTTTLTPKSTCCKRRTAAASLKPMRRATTR